VILDALAEAVSAVHEARRAAELALEAGGDVALAEQFLRDALARERHEREVLADALVMMLGAAVGRRDQDVPRLLREAFAWELDHLLGVAEDLGECVRVLSDELIATKELVRGLRRDHEALRAELETVRYEREQERQRDTGGRPEAPARPRQWAG